MASLLKLMGHPARLLMLCRMDKGEVSVRQLIELTGLSQSSVSQHLALLRKEGVVSVRGQGRTHLYRVKEGTVRRVVHAFCQVCEDVPRC
jgi:DNA-binding transcriptional ArsR family regulator